MNDPAAVVEEDVVEEIIEDDDDGILEAVDMELELVGKEPEPEPEPIPEGEKDEEPIQTSDTPETEGGDEPVPEDKPADDGEPKPDAEPEPEPKPDAEDKPSDEFEALDKDVPEKTKERFETLKSRFDEVAEERDNALRERQQILDDAEIWKTAITNTGTTPEQFGATLNYLGKVNSNKPEDLEEAYTMMQGELETLGKRLGKKSPGGYDPLTEHPDLQEKVRTGMLDDEVAYELAETRAKSKLSKTINDSAQAETEQQNAIRTAQEEVKELSAHLKATDPNFEAKLPFMEPLIIAAVKSGAPPQRWKSMIRDAYEKMPNPAPVAAAPAKPVVPNPIRPTGSPAATDLQAEPGSEMEAINQALERGW